MSRKDAAVRERIGKDPWSGRHPIMHKRSGWFWKRRIRRVLRRIANAFTKESP